MNTAERLRTLRERSGLTPQQLADKIGVDRTTITKYETGGSKPTRSLQKLADFFNVSVDYILCNDPPSYYHDPETALLAQEAHDNPELRILFDASRKLSPKDLQTVTNLVKSLTGEE